ncbi:zinc knuckle CX2CX4HX4C [Artemisia annua]|uniref:Zinc knuckle CX2CX4HX4C n=1 Tax=Artemisia annua TaxID=35608 RepID=A0A2U1NJU7_ARTAN|nr:zinc knuckle CX2CX4HX4C [Artemisia annua]
MSDIDPHPPNPDPKNPNSIPPPLGSNDVVRTKRNTRSSSNDAKLSLKNKKVIAKPHTGSLRKGSKKGNKNRDLTKEMEEIEYEDDVSEDMEVKDEVFEVNDKCSKASMGSRSQGMTELDGGSNSAASTHDKSQVSSIVDKTNDNIGTSGELKCSLNANDPSVVNTKASKMCDRGYGRASYARVLVEIDAAKGLVDNVEICYNSLGRSMGLRVEYTWRPPVCSHCKVFGHDFVNCVNRVLTEEEIKEKGVTKNGVGSKPVDVEKRNVGLKFVNTEKKNEVWQDVNGRNFVRNSWGPDRGYYQQNRGPSNVNRGGFNGRGGFNNRGGGTERMNNGGRNSNMQPLPTKSKEVNIDGSHEVMEKVEVDGKSKDIGNVGNGGTDDSKKFIHSELNTSNRFNALADEKCASKEKGKKINELKSKISKLQKDISYSNRNVAMTAKDMANKLCNMGMIEDGLTRNQNFSKVYDNVYKEELKRIKELVKEKGKAEVEFFVETEQVMTEEVKST